MATKNQGPDNLSLEFIEGLYADFLRDSESVPQDWRPYFEELARREGNGRSVKTGPSFRTSSIFNPPSNGHGAPAAGAVYDANQTEIASFQHRVDKLIRNFRSRGHRIAKIDPLGMPRTNIPELHLEFYDFKDEDFERPLPVGIVHGVKRPTLKKVITRLRKTYCRSIGVQYMHIDNQFVREWLEERMEGQFGYVKLSREDQLRIFTRLTDAVIFEEFIQKKYVGTKRFSLEGAETLVPLLAIAVEKAGAQRIDEIIIGMAHRGRLNVLANVMGKSPRDIFREFDDKKPELHQGGGDVKYHLGYHTNWQTLRGHNVHLALCFNPSHLEFVNTVVMGRVRAKQDRERDLDRERGLAVLIHGDAAFAGEGIIQETLNLSGLDAYSCGGTLHIIVNNQIGFTTNPSEGRSSVYAADVAKMLQTPIFHVNGEDPEAVAQVVNVAMEYRMTFKRDVVIDMYCYRKYGHNEGDEPAFTQPLMYQTIRKRETVRDAYLEHLLELGGITPEEAEEIAIKRREHLEAELSAARSEEAKEKIAAPKSPSSLGLLWKQYRGGPDRDVPDVDTGVELEQLSSILQKTAVVPEWFEPHEKIQRILDQRVEMAAGKQALDWAAGEALAFGSLAIGGARVRISGQDSERGTFSHRHAVLHDMRTDEKYVPLQHLADRQAPVELYNSALSEAGVLGFEYGYSLATPDGITIWEAQFGDFANVAQVILDQFISSSEDKWNSLSNITMLLPHGFEGMGPEHSSARIERFLSLTAEDNMQVVVPSTPAQMFHVLRRQVIRPWRKPLIVITPKSLLRHPKCVSPLAEFGAGTRFQRLMPDANGRVEGVDRILMCSGKIYYELDAVREQKGLSNVAILRVEQLYPLQPEHMASALYPYKENTPVYWVQEEPENMGAWRRMRGKFGDRWLGKFPLKGVYRPASASPATGSASSHKLEQQMLLDEAFENL
ncbi:MAG: hypothetical protein AMXMBFR84_20720 [Candidatus Hydrogenedentota bacterium]